MKPKVKIASAETHRSFAQKVKKIAGKVRGALKYGLVAILIAGASFGAGTLIAKYDAFSYFETIFAPSDVLEKSDFNYEKDWYLSQKSINYVANEIGADMSVMKVENDSVDRLLHNGNEPIYVLFNESVEDDYKAVSLRALDHIFAVVGKINENYRYKVVDSIEQYIGNRSCILIGDYSDIEIKPLNSAIGLYYSNQKKNKNKDCFNYLSKIYIKQADIKKNYNSSWETVAMQVVIHEALHAFGFDDTYTNYTSSSSRYYSNTYYENTFMLPHGKMSDRKMDTPSILSENIFPEDVERLCAAYAEPNKVKDTRYLDYLKELCNSYEEIFYSELLKTKSATSGTLGKNILKYKSDNFQIKLIIDENKYSLSVFGTTGERIETISGEAKRYVKNIEADETLQGTAKELIVLKDVNSNYLQKLRGYDDLDGFSGTLIAYKVASKEYEVDFAISGYKLKFEVGKNSFLYRLFGDDKELE